MIRRITPLLVLLSVVTGLIVVNSTQERATAVTQRIRPDLPPGIFVARVYYKTLEELNGLATYDVWEFNNLEERYVLVALDGGDYINLEQKGWLLQVDEAETAQLASIEPPFEMGYRTVDEIYSSLEELNSQYPQLTELVKYGESTCLAKSGCTTPGGDFLPGYDLLALRVSNENVPGVSSVSDSAVSMGNKPVFFLLANIHARELTTPEIAMRLLDHLLVNYGENADVTWLVDWHEIWVIPTANPDGHWLVELGAYTPYESGAFYQRKNANLDADGDNSPDCSVWPPEISWQYGVDLNRNHHVAWGGPGSSPDPCSQTYRGPEFASENEVASLQALVQALIPDQRGENVDDAAAQSTTGLLLTLHSFGELILWPWGYSENRAPNYTGLKAIGDKLAYYNDYLSCQASTCLYSASGTTDDWAYGELGIPAFTYEIGQRFMPDYSWIDEILWPANLPSFLYAARIARTPYETVLGPDVHDVRGTVSTEGKLLEITATIDDSEHGGNKIAAASYSIDLPYWAPGAITQPMVAVDGVWDDKMEAVTAAISVDSIDLGNHTLYVNGQDSEGHWGVTSASIITTEADDMINIFIPFIAYSLSP